MRMVWQAIGILGVATGLAAAAEPSSREAGSAGPRPALTLDLPALRETLERLDWSWGPLDKLPDIRLQLNQPEDAFRSDFAWDNRLKAVELRLPLSPVWVGYQLPTTGEEARAILSIKLGF